MQTANFIKVAISAGYRRCWEDEVLLKGRRFVFVVLISFYCDLRFSALFLA